MYLAKTLSSKKHTDEEKIRHDKALEKYQHDMGDFEKKHQQYQDWLTERYENKKLAEGNLHDTDDAFTLYRFHAYRGGINFDWGGVAYDVFKKEIGGPVHHYDGLVEHAITKALGKRIHDDPLGKHALGNDGVPVRPNFPKEYMLTNKKYPIPGVGFARTPRLILKSYYQH
ncbi:hypothetical protein QZH41_017327 [Actinostola sp. cb2023]|nr:hypothetical protein QZH41_017327 [Actinostola sp. cb2023]